MSQSIDRMPTATLRSRQGAGLLVGLVLVAALLLLLGFTAGLFALLVLIALPTAVCCAYLLWRLDPAYTLCLAFLLSPFSGHWQNLGFPTGVDPDRFLLCTAIVQVIFRAPAMRNRPRFRLTAAHAFLAAAVVYVIVSGLHAHTLFQKAPLFKLVDSFGLIPFLIFLVAPVAFRTPRHRSLLLATFVVMGFYLSLTTICEIAGIDAFVFPKYILNPHVGIQFGRGRGPFTDAVANGFAMYCCLIASGIAWVTWRRSSVRAFAALTGLLCFIGTFIAVQRSVWIGAAAGTIIMMMATSGLRRYLLPAAAVGVCALLAALALIPSLGGLVSSRANEVSTVYDRQNLTVAAVNMIEAKPLTGFGWQMFQSSSQLYFRRSQNFPLTATTLGIHNFLLSYGVDLGLPGLTLWLGGLLLGIGGALLTRGPPDLAPWRIGLIGVFVIFLVIANSIPPSLFTNLVPWLWAGVVFSGRYAEGYRQVFETRGAPPPRELAGVPSFPWSPAAHPLRRRFGAAQ
jgi:O-antigen ligase